MQLCKKSRGWTAEQKHNLVTLPSLALGSFCPFTFNCAGSFIHSGLKTQPKRDSDGEELHEMPLPKAEFLSECLISEKNLW